MAYNGFMNKNKRKIKEYPYLYETHLHTSQSSICASSSGKELACACKEYGYTGIIVTDHNWYGNTAIKEKLSWAEWVNRFCKGYEDAKQCGDRIGLDVFFGYESFYDGTEFLIYGVDQEWLLSHPQIKDAGIAEQYELVHQAGGMVIHAHPFREEWYIPAIRLFPEYVDGVEAVNGAHSNILSKRYDKSAYNAKAFDYAGQHKLPVTAGSDVHNTAVFGGGIACKRRLTGIQDYIMTVMSDEDYLLTDGVEWYSKNGDKWING